uniref:Putative ovule protein n=1 Tax=Solanum chacoense TaxID=4108 RepID=A0A0V0HD81_SOLCH
MEPILIRFPPKIRTLVFFYIFLFIHCESGGDLEFCLKNNNNINYKKTYTKSVAIDAIFAFWGRRLQSLPESRCGLEVAAHSLLVAVPVQLLEKRNTIFPLLNSSPFRVSIV